MSRLRIIPDGKPSWSRAMDAIAIVRERARRVTALLDEAGVPYAVIGGNAVAAWVASIDPGAQRATQDVDLLLRREDIDLARSVLEPAGFLYAQTMDGPMFLDGPDASPRDAVHIIYAGEKVRQNDLAPTAEVTESKRIADFQVVSLEALVRMKLTSYRRKDQVHIEDMINVGLIDASWVNRFPPELAARLQHILDTPDG